MKKIYLLALVFLFSSGSWAAAKQPELLKNHTGKYVKKTDLLKDIENLRADSQDFVGAIESREIGFREVSPPAVANYMEAFADEGVLESIPRDYFDNEEVMTSLYVVFEDMSNINCNKPFYEHDFKALRKRDLLKDIESLKADSQEFVDAIENKEIGFKEVSPPAVANYMEAFADEGILESIPPDYFDSEEVTTSLYVVLEDPVNIAKNWDMFEDRFVLKRKCSGFNL